MAILIWARLGLNVWSEDTETGRACGEQNAKVVLTEPPQILPVTIWTRDSVDGVSQLWVENFGN